MLNSEKGLFGWLALAGLLMAAFITAPAWAGEWDIGADSKQRNEALYSGQVKAATVIQVREVAIAPTTTAQTVSAGLGAVAGGALASNIGKGNGRYVAGALGAMLGGVAGKALGEKISYAKAQEVIVKKDDGQLAVITQAESNLQPGQAVFLVMESYGKVRVIPATSGI